MLQLVRCYWTETKPQGNFFTINCYLHGKHVDLSCTEAKTWPQLHPSDINEKRKTFQGISATLSTSKDNESFVSSLKIREETFSSRHLHIHWLRSIFNNFAHTTPYKISNHRIYAHSHVLINGDIREAWNMNSGTANIIISEIFSFSITYQLFRPFMDLRPEPQVEIIITLFPFYACHR